MPNSYTPGPWYISQLPGVHLPFVSSGPLSRQLYICRLSFAESELGDMPTTIANAKLISAAPELLQQLVDTYNKLIETLPSTFRGDAWITELFAANDRVIRKATK